MQSFELYCFVGLAPTAQNITFFNICTKLSCIVNVSLSLINSLSNDAPQNMENMRSVEFEILDFPAYLLK